MCLLQGIIPIHHPRVLLFLTLIQLPTVHATQTAGLAHGNRVGESPILWHYRHIMVENAYRCIHACLKSEIYRHYLNGSEKQPL